jgi:hypothetical protein
MGNLEKAMEDLWTWVSNIPYVTEVVSGIVAAHALAVFIVNITPTPTDDKWVATIYKYVEWVAGLITQKAKETGKEKK